MQVVILCGGKGTRLAEYTEKIPKPLVHIGPKPILWHIMKFYASHGHNDFILCLGYKGHLIKEFFKGQEGMNVTYVDTGLEATKGERLKQVEAYITGENFFLAYGDDLSDVDLTGLLAFHESHGKTVTLTAVNPLSQFGVLQITDSHHVTEFKEKPPLGHWINGGFFVLNRRIFKSIKEGWDLEKETFEHLAKQREIKAYKHDGFWKCMNTFKDTHELNNMWEQGDTPWKRW
jgi:glucose-1-phosphate cytidylyltransferase